MPSSQPTSDEPLASIPPLSYVPAKTPAARTSGLRLISDSIAQQRQTAASTVIFSPLSIAILVALLGVTYSFLYKSRTDAPLLFTTFAGEVMAALVAVRFIVSPYVTKAEEASREFLFEDEKGRDGDMVFLATFGEEVIGSLVYRIDAVPGSPGASRRRRERKVGVIRAWTVRRRERGRGVGRGLLEEVVRICMREKGCENVEFEDTYDGVPGAIRGLGTVMTWCGVDKKFGKVEGRARNCLKDVIREVGGSGGGRRRSR